MDYLIIYRFCKQENLHKNFGFKLITLKVIRCQIILKNLIIIQIIV